MIELIKTIIKTDIEEIIGSSMSLDLLNCYSKLFLNGAQPSTCSKCLRDYYRKIVIEGLEKAKIMAEKKDSTHKYAKKGVKYIGIPFCRHFNLQEMTDEEANDLLKKGFLKEEDFKILPEDYKSKGQQSDEDEKEEIKLLTEEYKNKTFDAQEIGKLKKIELVAYANVKKYPIDDWKELNAKDLAKYLKAKIEPNK